MKRNRSIVPTRLVEHLIFSIRRKRVMLDSDLAQLYGVETRILVRNLKRNLQRFPADFMFQLTRQEHQALKSQIGISKTARGGRSIVSDLPGQIMGKH